MLNTRTRKVVNRASEAFRMSAHAVGVTKSALGAYFRRIKQRAGIPKTITATASKLAWIFYRLMKHGQEYIEKGMDIYEKQYEERIVKNLEKSAKKLGFVLMKQIAEISSS
ncbi:hypothetical protein EDM53_05325 [Rickettsiales endosymbiont of Peranema trichophorum]|nr:hypothetical protein EDM53_05325 [Rickettsiales endosymbiont of Peranema trichophorum]